MTEPYEYVDPDDNALTAEGISHSGAAAVVFTAQLGGVTVPTTDVPDVIRGILAQAAAATGRDGADPLAQACADIDAIEADTRTVAEVEARDAAVDRVLDVHAPLLYALGVAFLGNKDPLWEQYRRVQAERDEARRQAETCKAQVAHWHRTAKAFEQEATRLRTAWHSAKRRAIVHGSLSRSRFWLAEHLGAMLGETIDRHTKIRRTVAEWIYDVNSGDDRDASDLMHELDQAGVPLTAELDAIEAARTQADEPGPVARVVDTGTYDAPDDTTTLPTLDANGMTADQWNAAHPVGTPVNVCIKTGELIATATRTRAWTLGSGHAVVSVTGMTGGISLGCVEPREAAEQHPA